MNEVILHPGQFQDLLQAIYSQKQGQERTQEQGQERGQNSQTEAILKVQLALDETLRIMRGMQDALAKTVANVAMMQTDVVESMDAMLAELKKIV